MKKHYAFFPKSWARVGLFTAISVFPYLGLQAQTTPSKQWDKTFGGNSVDNLAWVKQTSDGGYIMAGSSDSGINGDKTQASRGSMDYWIVKTDASGIKTWDKTFGGSSEDNLRTIQQTADGGYILGGYSNSGVSGDKTQPAKNDFDYWIVKLDASGNKTWDKNIGGNAIDHLYSLQQTADGGYILAGTSTSGIGDDKSSASKGGTDFWVVKLNAFGGITWEKAFGGSGAEALYSVQQTTDGGYVLAGSSDSGISGDKSQASNGLNDYWIVKLDANGTKTWDKSFGGSGDDVVLYSMQQTTDGGYILGGSSSSGISGDKTEASKGGADYWVVKLDATGTKTWDKTIGGSGADNLRSLQQSTDGGFILGGTSASGIGGDKTEATKGGNDYWVVKLNANGSKSWDKTLGGTGAENINSLRQTTDGGFILGGYSDSGITGDKSQAAVGGNDFWAVKLTLSAPAGPKDVSVTAIPGLTSGCTRTNQETISITVENKGTASQSSIPVSYKINTGAWINETIPGPLAPNASITYPFTAKANLSAVGSYMIKTRTALTSDALAANDSLNHTITLAIAPAAPTVSAGGPTTFCSGGTVTLTASSATTGATYQWFKDGVAIGNANAASYIADDTGIYTVTAASSGCSGPASAATAITMNTTPIAPALTASGPLAICSNGSVAFNVASIPGATITWFKDGTIIPGPTTTTYTTTTAGSYTVTATLNGCTGPASTASVVTTKTSPATPTISQAGMVLTSSSTTGNQWYKNSAIIAGATGKTYTATSNGTYTVIVTANSCPSATSNAVAITNTGINDEQANLAVSVYPNPSTGLFHISLPNGKGFEMTVTDLTGKTIRQQTATSKTAQLDLHKAAKGIYILKIEGEGKTATHKLFVE